MYSELKYNYKLSKRLEKDFEFRCKLFPVYKIYIYIEDGIKQAKKLKSNESIFSSNDNSDTDEEIENILSRENHEESERVLIYSNKLIQALLALKRILNSKLNGKKLFLTPFFPSNSIKVIKSIRFLDFVFPLNAEIFQCYGNEKSKEFITCCNIYEYKRASSVIYNKNKQSFIIKMHEKVFDKVSYSTNLRRMNYYLTWLHSLNNKRAYHLMEDLKELVKAHENKIRSFNAYFHKSRFQVANDQKVIIKELDQYTRDFVSKHPHFIRTHSEEIFPTSEKTG